MIIVDRIENGIAICEIDNEFTEIALLDIIGNVREGAVLIKTNGNYVVDEDNTSKRKKDLFEKQRRLFSK